MNWLDNILGWSSNSIYNPQLPEIGRERDNGRQGKSKRTINIRILYPHHSDGELLNLTDLFCFLLYHSIETSKGKFGGEYMIGEVRMDRKNRGDSKNKVHKDIVSSDCIVIIILSSDKLDTHKTYYEELLKCKEVIETKYKAVYMFFPIFLCGMKKVPQECLYFKQLAEANDLNYLPYVLNYSLDLDVESYMNDLWRKLENQLPSLSE